MGKVAVELDHVPRSHEKEVYSAAEKALSVGAVPPLVFVGIGMTAVVVCDSRNHAFKVARRQDQSLRGMLTDEYFWLVDAYTEPSIRRMIAKPYAFYVDPIVIERDCPMPDGERRPVAWCRVRNAYDTIVSVMEERGWMGPEYKEDSFVITKRGPVLVDAGFVQRSSWNLARYALQIARGQIKIVPPERPRDVLWALRMEHSEGRIPERTLRIVSDALTAAFPDEDWRF